MISSEMKLFDYEVKIIGINCEKCGLMAEYHAIFSDKYIPKHPTQEELGHVESKYLCKDCLEEAKKNQW